MNGRYETSTSRVPSTSNRPTDTQSKALAAERASEKVSPPWRKSCLQCTRARVDFNNAVCCGLEKPHTCLREQLGAWDRYVYCYKKLGKNKRLVSRRWLITDPTAQSLLEAREVFRFVLFYSPFSFALIISFWSQLHHPIHEVHNIQQPTRRRRQSAFSTRPGVVFSLSTALMAPMMAHWYLVR